MARKTKNRELELIVEESVDEKTGLKTTIRRRGLLELKSKSLEGPHALLKAKDIFSHCGKTLRQEFEEEQEAIRIYLDKKGIPSGRVHSFVSVNGGPFRPHAEKERIEVTPENLPWYKTWYSLAREMTEELSRDRAYVDYLFHLSNILRECDDKILPLVTNYAYFFCVYKIQESNMHTFAFKAKLSIEKSKPAGKKSGVTRLAKAEKNWREPALELAIDLLEKKPELSQSGLASEITDNWKGDPKWLPPHDRLVKFIRGSERSGALRPRKKGT
ncbi:MAG: hypothetical protein ACT4O2_12710 [Beijerinckiaceae bacterium]